MKALRAQGKTLNSYSGSHVKVFVICILYDTRWCYWYNMKYIIVNQAAHRICLCSLFDYHLNIIKSLADHLGNICRKKHVLIPIS